MQKVYVSGKIGSVSELKETSDGKKRLSFSVAVNERYKQKNGDFVVRTLWTSISLWGTDAVYWGKRLTKGASVGVWGKLEYDDSGHPRIYQNKDNVACAEFTIRADSFGVELFTPQNNSPEKQTVGEEYSEESPF